MGKFFDSIPDFLTPWITKQHMFWVASAPIDASGHVNLSPKCTRGTFHIIDSTRVWYEDMSGSGIETISHIRENGRITILFHAFEGPPRIVRLFGTGTVYEFGTPEYTQLISPEKRVPGSRAVIMVDVHKVGTSCGYAIPYYTFNSHRNQLLQWAQKRESEDDSVWASEYQKSEKGLRDYWLNNNSRSIDGIPGLATAPSAKTLFKTGHLKFDSDDHDRARVLVGRKSDGGFGLGLGFDRVVDLRFLLGFLLGVVGSAVYVRLFQLV